MFLGKEGEFQIIAVIVTYDQGGILALADKRYDALQKLNQMDSFYDYEKQFVDIGRFLKEILALFLPTSVKNFTVF
ncbi:MAG: hypothetical protein ORN54_05575 [Cyclobacteriaceae bacterium]|nr:hypothetical protein [Cyclobacteriaceae bacterium]